MRDLLERDRPQSPLEELFLQGTQKYANLRFRVRSQLPAETPQGAFRLDVALLTPSDRVLGFELDGQAYHEDERDLWRDAAILTAGHCEAIYRITGRDLVRYAPHVWYLLSRLEPSIVAARAREVLARQVGPDRPGTCCSIGPDSGYLQFDLEPNELDPDDAEAEADPELPWDFVSMERRTRTSPEMKECARWLAAYPTLRLHAIRQLAAAGGGRPTLRPTAPRSAGASRPCSD
jgi:hypothetical protein